MVFQKAKLNDIAILALDNDQVKYEEFMKKNVSHLTDLLRNIGLAGKFRGVLFAFQPKISGDEVAIARVAFHKLVETSLEKIKNDPKLEGGWKKIFIQFKSRNEKRRNWKEKQKLYKEIEEKMQVKNEDDDDDEAVKDETEVKVDGEETADQTDLTNGQEDGHTEVEVAKKVEVKKEKKKKTKEEVKKDETPMVDSDGHGDDENDLAYNPEEDEELLNMEREVAFSDDDEGSETGSMPDFGFSFGEEDNSNTAESEAEPVPAKKKPKKEPKSSAPVLVVPKRDLKPLVVENKPTRMVIKQINLDELKDLNEIPIESTPVEEDEGDESELTVVKKGRYDGADDYEAEYNSKTIKATEDPFFLDPDGREIQDIHNLTEKNNALYYNNRFNKPRYRKDDDDFDYNFDEKDEFIQKRTSLNNSSFKSSLSSRDTGYRSNGRDGRSFNSDRGGYGQRPQRFDSSAHRGRGDAFRSSNGGDYQRNKRPFENGNRSSQYNSHASSQDAKPSVDLAKNHPSWLAKKQQEEKLKNQKFEGKKITFDD